MSSSAIASTTAAELIGTKRAALLEGDEWFHNVAEEFWNDFMPMPPYKWFLMPLVNVYADHTKLDLLSKNDIKVLIVQTAGCTREYLEVSAKLATLIELGLYKPEAVIILMGERELSHFARKFPEIDFYAWTGGPDWELELIDKGN